MQRGNYMSFKDFWTNENNPSLPMQEYLYNTRHILVLVAVCVVTIIMALIFARKSKKCKNILFTTFAVLFLFFEILSRIVNLIVAETYTVESIAKILLPMHICSVMVWIFIFALFTKRQWLINYSAIGGIIATLVFLLYPAVGLNRVYMSFTCLYSTISHCLGFVCCVLLIALGKTKFELRKVWQPLLCFVVMFAYGALLNFVIFPGSDYMYMVNDPLQLNLSIPYQLVYSIALVLYTFAFHFIYELVQKHKKRKEK